MDNGVGLWGTTPSFMEFFRKDLRENAQAFLEAFVPLVEAGYAFSANRYKRDKPGTEEMPEVLQAVYNQRELYFLKRSNDISLIATPDFVDYMKTEIEREAKMYRYLDNLYQRFQALER